MSKAIKCSNCGKITQRISVLPLCENCLIGLEDYESKYSESLIDVQIKLEKTAPKTGPDNFLKI
jgi:hypothetical protein